MGGKRVFLRLALRQKLLIFAVLLAVIALLSACNGRGSDPLSYRLSPLTAELRGRISPSVGDRVEFSATLTLGEWSAEGERELEMVFHAPESLDGLCFRRDRSGGVTVSLGEIECRLASGDVVSGIMKIAGMLEAEEEILSISSIPGSEAGLIQYERLTLITTAGYSLLIDPHTETPVKAWSVDGGSEICFDAVTQGR